MYAQVEKSKEYKNRSVVNSVGQKTSNGNHKLGFVNNRPDAVVQKKMENMAQNNLKPMQLKSVHEIANNSKQAGRSFAGDNRIVTQLLKVADDHVRADLRHPDREKLFTDDTFVDILNRTGLPNTPALGTGAVSNGVLDAAVNASRAAGEMDYNQLSTRKVTSEKQMTSFLDINADDEHMYVLDSGELHVASRAEDKKLPHPTLVGGDPDVDCAGTLRFENGTVIVTCSSGHFRPPTEGKGKKAVAKMMEKSAKSSYKKPVKGKRR